MKTLLPTALVFVMSALTKSEVFEIDQLYEDLFYNYQKISRPNRNASDKIVVEFAAFLIRIIDIDERNQIITVNLWLEMASLKFYQWFDWRFSWAPGLYGGIKKLNIPSDHIWTPDILLYNNADGLPYIPTVTDALVYHDGKVLWSTPAIYKAFCQIDITYFPYDEQNCKLNSAEWDLMNLTSIRRERVYPGCCGQFFYIDITFWITIRRKALFFTVNLVIPCMLIAFLTTSVFYLTDHKVTFAISVLVALSVFFLVLIELIPPTSLVVPLFAQYLLFTMLLVTISILATVIILNIHHRDSATHKMPNWVRTLFLKKLPRIPILCLKVPDWHQVDPKLAKIKKMIHKNAACGERYRGSISNRRPSPYFISADEGTDKESRLRKLATSQGMHPMIIKEMINNVNFIAGHFAALEDGGKDSDDWSYVAYVIDRLFLILFTLINIVGTLVIVMKAPIVLDGRNPLPVPEPTKPLGGDILSRYY
uniref:Uncharacterized protein n=1 Tax=Romanomermis culicivorax TaxID=13658 RepID=A0A915ICI3_ROMCU